MRKKIVILWVITTLVLGLLQLTSQERRVRVVKKRNNQQNKRIALVVGNSYKNTKWELKNPINDAQDIYEVLKNCGFEVDAPLLDASKAKLKEKVREFRKALRNSDVGLFYYSGHGMQVDDKNYLIPVDADIQAVDEIETAALSLDYIMDMMNRTGRGINIIILDSCRNNPFASRERSLSRGLAWMDGPTGSLIVYSTSPGKTADDGRGRNGIFTKHLIKSIKDSDYEIMDLLRQVRKNVILETNKKQIPWESSSLVSDFYFSYQVYESSRLRKEIQDIESQLEKFQRQTKKLEKIKSEKDKRENQRKIKEIQRAKDTLAERLKKLEEIERKNKERQDAEEKEREAKKRKAAEEKKKIEQLRKKIDAAEAKNRSLRLQVISVPDAEKEVVTLRSAINKERSRLEASKEEELKQLEDEYSYLIRKTERSFAPKDGFESTENFNERSSKHKQKLASLDNEHQDKINAAKKKFRNNVPRKTRSFFQQMVQIIDKKYPVKNLKVKLLDYCPDKELYKVQLSLDKDKEWRYYFSISPPKARELRKRETFLQADGFCEALDKQEVLIEPSVIDPAGLGKIPLHPLIILPSTPRELRNNEDIQAVVNRFKFYFSKGIFESDFELKEIIGDKVVIDYLTGLMWHQSGSPTPLPHDNKKKWLQKLNNCCYAGYHDWRLPTLEESASLLESKNSGGMHIAPLFSGKQKYIWTCDSFGNGLYVVDFVTGRMTGSDHPRYKQNTYIRPVRSLEHK